MSSVTEATGMSPFRIVVRDDELAELRRRIAAVRRPSRELVEDRSQGVQLATVQELARYWQTDYDWRAGEARLNELPQFTTDIDGVPIHFIQVWSPHPNALPLVITHGWPGSVLELLGLVGPLTDPPAHGGQAEDAFDLVLPSLPGYGFSGQPVELGWKRRTDRSGLGRVDAPARLPPLRRPGRRRRRGRDRRDGPAGARRARRHPPQPAAQRTGRRHRLPGWNRAGTRGGRGDHHVPD